MEGSLVDWKDEGEKAPEDYNSDAVIWLLKKGLSVGKMMLVTGIVISSAPVLLPPLVIISAFGIAISVPYGVFLATYACTEKLMAFLLPKAVPPSMEKSGALTYDDGKETKDTRKMKEEDEQDKSTRNGGEMRWGSVGEENETEETPRGEILEMETRSIKEEDGEKQPVSEEPEPKNDGKEEKRSEIEVIPEVLEEKKDQDKANNIKIQDESAKEATGGQPKESKKKAKRKKLDQDAKKGVEDKDKDKEMGPKVDEIVQVMERKTTENIENKAMQDKKSPQKAKNLNKGLNQTAQNGSGKPPLEEAYSEKKIWEEIKALRTIVGYKAPLRQSTMEELRDLYRFTGIEPPASTKDPSDPAEVTNKLRFLMAIVGVN